MFSLEDYGSNQALTENGATDEYGHGCRYTQARGIRQAKLTDFDMPQNLKAKLLMSAGFISQSQLSLTGCVFSNPRTWRSPLLFGDD